MVAEQGKLFMVSLITLAVVIFSTALHAIAAEKLDRVRIGYSSIASTRIALWVANDMGFFKRNGLAGEVIVTPGVQGTQALIAGELQFYLGGIDSAALAASRGSDLVALATAEPIEYKLVTLPNIKTAKDLSGKNRCRPDWRHQLLHIAPDTRKGRLEDRRCRTRPSRRRG